MREKHTVQSSLFHLFADHQISQELQAMSEWLDAHPEVLDWVEADLRPVPIKDCGRKGLPVESVLRCAILKQCRQLSYEELAFYLMDSYSLQAFARLPLEILPKKAVLQQTISQITEATWEKINQVLLESAQTNKLESGQVIRMDSTATKSTIHDPSDSSLLWDSIRVLVRLFNQAQEIPGAPALPYRNHQRRAKNACALSATREDRIRKRPCTKIYSTSRGRVWLILIRSIKRWLHQRLTLPIVRFGLPK